ESRAGVEQRAKQNAHGEHSKQADRERKRRLGLLLEPSRLGLCVWSRRGVELLLTRRTHRHRLAVDAWQCANARKERRVVEVVRFDKEAELLSGFELAGAAMTKATIRHGILSSAQSHPRHCVMA